MKSKVIITILALTCMACLSACRKNKITGGGWGGNAAIRVAGQHDGRDLDSCWIFIKYNATEAPKTTGFDDSAVAAVRDLGRPLAMFSHLTTGNYYLFARAYDPVYQQGATGSLVVTIDRDREYDINIPMDVK